MTTLAVFGDRHYAKRFPRAPHVLEVWDWAIADALAHGATAFVGVGDVCESDPDGDERYELGQRYRRMVESSDRVIEILGNHETYTAHRWLQHLRVTVVWDQILVTEVGDTRLICCPYPRLGWPPFEAPIEDARQRALWTLAQILRETPKDLPVIFLAHATPEHATTRNTRFELHNQAEVVIPRDLMRAVDLSVFGHVHRPQTVWPGGAMAWGFVVGSMVRVDFDEAEDEKRYLLVTVDGDRVDVESRPLPVRPMVELKLAWTPGLTLESLNVGLEEPATVAGADVKISVQVPVDVAATYTPEIFERLRASAATFTLHKTIETPAQQRRAALPPDATFTEEVRDCLDLDDARMQELAPKIAELEEVR